MKAIQSITVVLAGFLASTCHADEASAWLDRMAAALREQNYQGTFTYMRGSQFETINIVHQFVDGEENERLVHQSGEEREVIRSDDEVVCYHPNSPSVKFDHIVPLGPFSAAFNENLAAYQSSYRFSLHGKDRIAGRSAVKLKILPRNNDRFGYRLWLDEQTGLLLQSQLVERGRVLELFQFSQIEIGEPVAGTVLASSMGNDALSHRLSPELDERQQTVKPGWRVSWLPDGFKAVKTRESNRLHFSDGLATLSVFVDQKVSTELPDMTTHHGATSVIIRRMKGAKGQITVVGEVPINTARKIAESVEPVIY
jgi:sigma-E factor negative regulatory protein RseB